MAQPDLLHGLNDEQRAAVLHQGSPLLLLAGAGSGKTRVITVKIAWLIQELGFDPRSILAVTFTNKAAQEMRERATALVPAAAEVMIRTFHSFGAWFLRRNAAEAGLSPNFTIYDDEDQVQLLASLFPDKTKQERAAYAQAIGRSKDFALDPESTYGTWSDHPELPAIFNAYEKRLREIGNVDFGDLILRPLELLRQNSAVRDRLRYRYRVVLVDEYQDSNIAQYELLRQIAGETTYVCVVGDDDQSIYRFRGADVDNIVGFPERFPGTTIVRLERNYRSTKPILDLAGAVVEHNTNRLGKTMWTDRTDGDLPELWLFDEQDDEVATIVRSILNHPTTETAILYRTNAQSRNFEAALLRAAIPYRIIGTLRFYEREEVRDALGLLRLLANPKDEIAFRRVINKPARSIGDGALQLIMANLAAAKGDLLRAADYAIPKLTKKAAAGCAEFLAMVDAAAKRLANGPAWGHLGELAAELLDKSGLGSFHHEQDKIGGTQKRQNLEEFLNATALYPASLEGLTEFLESAELDAASQNADNADALVTLITMHNTKGLEFDKVIISGLEEGVFPRTDEYGDDLEEQRRLFYVAVTRARNELAITYSRRKRVFGRWDDFPPSRFLQEIPEGLLKPKQYGFMTQPSRPAANAVPRPHRDEWAGYESGFGDSDDLDGATYEAGTRVSHGDYGEGTISQTSIKGGILSVIVEFDDGRRLKFLPQFTPLQRID